MWRLIPVFLSLSAVAVAGPAADDDPYPSTYTPRQSPATLIENAIILTGDGDYLESGYVLITDGVIREVGEGVADGVDAVRRIDGGGKWLTPGIIDVHSHLGDYPAPGYDA
ncbi:MAG: amidohydrolase, partial [Pseudomonadales bacterium]|nr:amidohydrolase [Pseudomonadales bacterium]